MTRTLTVLGALLVVCGVAFGAGRWTAPAESGVPVVDTVRVTPDAMTDRIRALTLERDGLRDRLAGRTARAPERIVVTDTVIHRVPDTVFVALRMDGTELSAGRLARVDSDTADGYRPTVPTYDAGGCDDGWSIGPDGFTCDKARLGHVYLTALATARVAARTPADIDITAPDVIARAGIAWTPTYRSGTTVALTYGSDRAWRLTAGLGFEVF